MKSFKKPSEFIENARAALPEMHVSLLTAESLRPILHVRGQFDHKGLFGHALLIAGSRGMCGAAILSATACLKSGIGLLDVLVPSSAYAAVQGAVPEAMVKRGDDEAAFSGIGSMDLNRYDAIGIGPGLGCGEKQYLGLKRLLETLPSGLPLVLDADALNLLARCPDLFEKLPPTSILTPHPGEFERLWQAFHPAATIPSDPMAAAVNRLTRGRCWLNELAADAQVAHGPAKGRSVYLVLKGAFTTILTPDGQALVNPTGNPGMATGGSGDVLTGILLSLSAQHYTPQEACALGVWLHGLSGDCALEAGESEESLTATCLTQHLGAAFRRTANEQTNINVLK